MKSWFTSDVIREMLLLLLAAVVLGLAYNHSSPLGVAFSSVPPRSAASGETVVARSDYEPSIQNDPALHNETITAVIVSSGPDTRAMTIHKLPASLPWPEVKSLLATGAIVLVDGRQTAAYQAGHIPGAISLPLQTLAETIGSFSAKYAKSRPLVIYCASIQCPISQTEATALAEQYGYQDVREMPGGFAEWRVAEPSAAPATGDQP
jgi:rhodanese-related sulfurtransferase